MIYSEILNKWSSYNICKISDIDKYLHNFRILFAYNSGKIENNEIDYFDTREVFENGRVNSYTGNVRTLKDWLKIIKQRIKQSQLKAAVRVNTEMLQLYWDIGKEIVQRDVESKWGSKIYSTLSTELKDAFPGMEGFSVTNLKYMKRFYQFYSNDHVIGQQLVDQLEKIYIIPWGHQILLISKCKSVSEALFYANKKL